MCIVGYEDNDADNSPGGGRFLIRNSWGERFGIESPLGAGYGTIPYAYITKFGVEAAVIGSEFDLAEKSTSDTRS
jgi:C1A family cysteine protease